MPAKTNDLNQLIEDKKQQIYFISLNKDIKLAGQTIKHGLDLPVDSDAIKAAANQAQDFNFKRILRDMCLLIGLDPDFAHNVTYRTIIDQLIANPYQYCLHLGVNAAQHKLIADAIGFFRCAITFSDSPLDAYFNLAKLYYGLAIETPPYQGALKLSYSAFMQAARIEHKPEIDYYLCFVNYSMARYSEALEHAKRALAAGLANEYQQDLMDKLAQIEDKDKYEKGYKFVLEERYIEALEQLLSISEQGEDNWRVQFFTGLAYRGDGQPEQAIMHFNKARDLNQIEVQIYNELAVTYAQLGDAERAKQMLMTGLSHQPLHVESLCNLALLHLQSNQIALADKFLNSAIDIAADDLVVVNTKAYFDSVKATHHDS